MESNFSLIQLNGLTLQLFPSGVAICRDHVDDEWRSKKEENEKIAKRKIWSRHHSLYCKTMEKPRKEKRK